jgi:hypothetical protein
MRRIIEAKAPAAIYRTAPDLHDAWVVDKRTLCSFAELCLSDRV